MVQRPIPKRSTKRNDTHIAMCCQCQCQCQCQCRRIEVDSLPGELRNSHHEFLVTNKMNKCYIMYITWT